MSLTEEKRVWVVRRILWIILMVVMMVCCVGKNTFAQENGSAEKEVRVGYYESSGFQEGAFDGEIKSGFGYEYLQKIASYAGWKYTYVYGDWAELYQKLLNGEIDLMAGIARNKERETQILFPDEDILEETFYIYKSISDASMFCGDITSYEGKKIGTTKDSKLASRLEKWKQENHADIQILYFDRFSECMNAFHAGQIDGFVSADNVVSRYFGIGPVERLGKEPYYLCVTKERKDLLQELNASLSILTEQDKQYLAEMQSRYAVDSSVNLFLSKEERNWIDTHDEITVGYLEHYLPYCDKKQDGTATGLVSNLMPDLFAALPGGYQPKIHYRGYESHEELIEGLQNGELDVIFPIGDESWYAEQRQFLLSTPVSTATMNLVYSDSYSEKTTAVMAVNKNNLLQYHYTQSNFPEAEIVEYNTIEECIQAVKNGKADSTIVNALRTSALVDSRLKLSVVPLKAKDDRCFGVKAGNNGLLILLNHGISILGDNYGVSIAYRYTDELKSYTVSDFVHDHVGTVVGAITVILMSVVIFTVTRYQKMRQNAEEELRQKEQLENALMQAQKADHAKSVFLHNMSHDIRTPLNGIMGILDINSKCTDSDLIQENRDKAKTAASHLLDLVNEVLEMSKLENGEVELKNETFCFADVMKAVQDMIEVQTAQAGIRLHIDNQTGRASRRQLQGSPLHIREVFVNILGNAIKYNKENGQIWWTTDVVSESESQITYRCICKDTGIGMSEEYLQHIFEPFSQAEKSARTDYQGTGLGMAIVKKLIDKMGGSIEIESEPEVGSQITVILPFTVAEKDVTAQPEKDNAQTDLAGMKILLAEDNDLNQEIAKYLLEEAGATVTVKKNGAEACEWFMKQRIGSVDVILMDIMMPVMNGYEATQAIRTSGRKDAKTVPIIAMTANAFEEDRKASVDAGMDEHLTKPLDSEKLIETIAKYKK